MTTQDSPRSRLLPRGPATAAPDSSGALVIERVSTLEAMHRLRDDWLRLEALADDSALIFQSWDWCWTWSMHFIPVDPSLELLVFVVRHDGRAVCILPAMLQCERMVCTLRWLTSPLGQYGDILVDPEFDNETTAAALFDHVLSCIDFDVVYLRHVRNSGVAGRWAPRWLQPSGHTETAPFMDLTQFADDDDYKARYTRVQRRRRRKIRKAVECLGEISFHQVESGESFKLLCDRAIADKQTWIAHRGLYSPALDCAGLSDFLDALAKRTSASVTPVITALTAGDRGVSCELALRYRGRHCAFITAHDPELTDLSPARLHMDRTQRRALADGMHTFDLMVPGDAYKASWSNSSEFVFDYALPLTRKGRVYHVGYIRALRPLARIAYLRSSSGVRQIVRRVGTGARGK